MVILEALVVQTSPVPRRHIGVLARGRDTGGLYWADLE